MTIERLAVRGGSPVRPERKPVNPRIPTEAKKEVMEVLDIGSLAQFYGGSHVTKFEGEYAEWFKRDYGVAVNSGTAALHVAYLGAEIEEFAEVLVPANAYISALIQCNLVPVIVDIEPFSWVMDPNDIKRKLNTRTRAIVAVHMYGQPCPMDDIASIAKENDLILIEDCGQSHGALWNGKLTGTFGLVACFSICCRKHIAVGEGGILITDSNRLSDLARAYAHKGKGRGWFEYNFMGFSYNMTEIQAILGLHGLRHLNLELERRQKFARKLHDGLEDLGLGFPIIPSGSTHAYFKFNFLVPENLSPWRNEIVHAIHMENIDADPSHPYVLEIGWLRQQVPSMFRLQGIVERPCYEINACPIARDLLARQIGLVVGPGIEEEDIDYTIEAVRKVFKWYSLNKSQK